MRVFVLALLVVGLVAPSSSTAAETTALRVTFWANSAAPARSVTWTLRCAPARGTVPRPARACTKLASGGAKLFAPTPKNVVCTEIYGGPQVARVVGTLDGQTIHATFSRRNGCEIGRWQRISPWLVPRGGVT